MSFKPIVSNPNGLPRPFSRKANQETMYAMKVSNPNGLPRPFIPHNYISVSRPYQEFQTRTGFPGHLAKVGETTFRDNVVVSNPNGLPRPFSLGWIVIN